MEPGSDPVSVGLAGHSCSKVATPPRLSCMWDAGLGLGDLPFQGVSQGARMWALELGGQGLTVAPPALSCVAWASPCTCLSLSPPV